MWPTVGRHVLCCPPDTPQTRSEWRASSCQMKADRCLFPGPGVSCEVSMFIMMILIILLTRLFFGLYSRGSRIPSRSKSLKSSVMCERSTTLLADLTLNHVNAWAHFDPFREPLSPPGHFILYFPIVNVWRRWMEKGVRVRGAGLLFGKFPHQVWFGKWKWNPSPLTYWLLKCPWAVHLSISLVELHSDREQKAGQV